MSLQATASRELQFTHADGRSETVQAVILAPVEVSDHVWHCEYQITGPSFDRTSHAAGDDSMQALILAVFKLSVDLEWLGRTRGGAFTWYGDLDLGLATPRPPET